MVLLIDPAVIAQVIRRLRSHTRVPQNGAMTVTGCGQESVGASSVFAVLTQISRLVMQIFYNLIILIGVLYVRRQKGMMINWMVSLF